MSSHNHYRAPRDSGPLLEPDALHLSPDQVRAILEFDTCSIANAIETFGVRLRNEGFTKPGIQCRTPLAQKLLGYAVTSQIRTADPPIVGTEYYDRTDWWDLMTHTPQPRVAVVHDMDQPSGQGSCVGEFHSTILQKLGCAGLITNGAIRDLPALQKMHFPVFSSSVAVSHSYVHILDFGNPVNIFGLTVHTGDLLYADCHGVLVIPPELASKVAWAAGLLADREHEIITYCEHPDFSVDELRRKVKGL